MDDTRSGQPRTRDTRGAPRDSLFLQATLRRDGDEAGQVVRVRNLSSGGMMAEVGAPFEQGSMIEIELRGIGNLRGTVVWRQHDRIGLAFASPIDPRQARKSVAVRPARATPAAPLRTIKRPKLFGD